MQYVLIKSVYLMFPSQYLVFAALSAPHHGIDARSLWTSALLCRLCSRSLELIPSIVFYLDDLKRDLFIFCMCVCAQYVCLWSADGVISLGNGIRDGCEPLCRC